ncbi:hypothetical protein PFISCL1PPCAC_19021, partial [Pristionchus fissidentatus]
MHLPAVLTLFISILHCTLPYSRPSNDVEDKDVPIYASPYEMIDFTIDYLCDEYPKMCVIGEQRLIDYKKEFLDFYLSPEEEQRQLIAGFPSRFKILNVKFQELGRITKKEFAALVEEGAERPENEFEYVMHVIVQRPAEKLILMNKSDFKKRKMSKEEIEKEVAEKQQSLFDLWHKDDDIDEL